MILTAENYYTPESNREYMSVSQFKSFERCESAAMAELRGEYARPKSTALLVGSYVDSHFEGTLDLFKAQNPEIFKRDGGLKADYARADEIINRIERDPLFMEYMSGEKQTICTAELFGCKWKVKTDSYFPGDKIVDLKCMRSIDRIMGVSFIEHWAYDVQDAVYQEVERLNSGNRLPFYIAVATKEDTPNIEIISVPQWRLDECLDYVGRKIPHILKVKSGEVKELPCGVCDWCKQNKVLTAPIDFEDVGFSAKELREMRGEF